MEFLIYIICLGTGLVFTLLSLAAGHMFGGHVGHGGHDIGSGGHAASGADGTDGPGMSAFSPTMVAAFITAFGGFGVIFHQIPSIRGTWMNAPLAMACGMASSFSLLWLLRQLMRRTQSSSEGHVGTLVGTSATVIGAIPQHGMGEIAYVQGGSRYTAPARSESGCAIAGGQTVKINRVVGTSFYVVPL